MPEDEAEITGVYDDQQTWIPFNPPLRVSLQGVPASDVTTFVEEAVAKHMDEMNQQQASSSTWGGDGLGGLVVDGWMAGWFTGSRPLLEPWSGLQLVASFG